MSIRTSHVFLLHAQAARGHLFCLRLQRALLRLVLQRIPELSSFRLNSWMGMPYVEGWEWVFGQAFNRGDAKEVLKEKWEPPRREMASAWKVHVSAIRSMGKHVMYSRTSSRNGIHGWCSPTLKVAPNPRKFNQHDGRWHPSLRPCRTCKRLPPRTERS